MNNDEHDKDQSVDFTLVAQIVESLTPLSKHDQSHVLQTVATWLKISLNPKSDRTVTNNLISDVNSIFPSQKNEKELSFTERVDISPKDFILEKSPRTDVERIACLAYYLTHYMDTPSFKTIDLSKLNTDAAQRKFSNPTQTAKNAVKNHFLVPASKKGCRQISALGEQYVNALPDREAAHGIRKKLSPRKKRRVKSSQGKSRNVK